jgi:hypothetical protein
MKFHQRAAELIGFNTDIRWDYSLLASFIEPATRAKETEWIRIGFWTTRDQQQEKEEEDRETLKLLRGRLEDCTVGQTV